MARLSNLVALSRLIGVYFQLASKLGTLYFVRAVHMHLHSPEMHPFASGCFSSQLHRGRHGLELGAQRTKYWVREERDMITKNSRGV